jgi:hypothetical protein
VTPILTAYPPGDIRRYGASASNTDNSGAINNALKCNPIVFDGAPGPTVYPVQNPIQFRAAGQTLRGAGSGDSNKAVTNGNPTPNFAPRTTLLWTSSTGGAVISLSDGGANYSETRVEDLLIDGGGVASYGIAYDDNLTTGCWRNVFVRVGVMNCRGVGPNPAAIYLGGNTSGFANDVSLHDCYLWACTNGVYFSGASHQLYHCTVGQMTLAGLNAPGSGAEAKCYGGVFHSNVIDILVGTSSPIQNIACFGTWFENSTGGVFDARNSFNLQLMGCHLHTFNPAYLINFRGQAGHAAIKSLAAGGSASYLVANTNAQYDYDLVGTGLTTDTGYKMKVVGLASLDNAKFFVAPAGTTSGSTGDGTVFSLNGIPVNKRFDVASSVNGSTGVFIAPATGYYHFIGSLELTGVTAAHNDCLLYVQVSNSTSTTYSLMDRRNPGTQLIAGVNECHISGSCVVPMTAGDAACLAIQVGGSARTVGVLAADANTNWRSNFQGRLA